MVAMLVSTNARTFMMARVTRGSSQPNEIRMTFYAQTLGYNTQVLKFKFPKIIIIINNTFLRSNTF